MDHNTYHWRHCFPSRIPALVEPGFFLDCDTYHIRHSPSFFLWALSSLSKHQFKSLYNPCSNLHRQHRRGANQEQGSNSHAQAGSVD